MGPRKYQFNNSTLTIIFGDILTSKAEVIVSSDDTGISMSGGISGCIRKAGGDEIRKDAQKKLPAHLGDVVVSTAGTMKHQKFIFHCLTIDYEHKDDVNEGRVSNPEDFSNYILQNSVEKCFCLMQALDLSSIAFPCIGGGVANIPLRTVAEVMADTIKEKLNCTQKQYEIELYIHDSNINDELIYLSFMACFENRLEQNKNQENIHNEEFYEDEFLIYLTVDGTSYENVEVIIKDPIKTIRDQIESIVQVFELPKMDNGGNPIQYLLGKMVENEGELEILEFEDEDGREQCLIDYNVQLGDYLHLVSVPVAGGGCDPMIITCLPRRKNIIKRLFRKKAKDVFSSVFAPNQVRKGCGMMIQVYLYKDEERDEVCYDAAKCDKKSLELSYSPLNFKLERGTSVDINIRMHGIKIERPHKLIVWQGCYTKTSFYAEIPEEYNEKQVWGEVFLPVEGALLGELDFLTEITTSCSDHKETAKVFSRQYKKIFISYAHQDESKVQYMARAYDAQGVDYFFDRHYLKPGDIFPLKIKEYIDSADLFILCWSANAAQSDYVDLERRQALERAFPKVKPFEDAPLSIYPISMEPRAELPADMRDTYNFEVI